MKILPLAIGTLLMLSGAARAQITTDRTPESQSPAVSTVEVKIRNVRPSLLAYWLDPAHQPMPQMIQVSVASGGKLPGFDSDNELARQSVAGAPPFPRILFSYASELPRQPGNGQGPLDLKLPADLEIVEVRAQQNVLIAKGTEESLTQLRKLLGVLDVPLNQVVIEAQFIRFKPADLAKLQLEFLPKYDDTNDNDKSYPTIAQPQSASRTATGTPKADESKLGFIRGQLKHNSTR